MNIYQKIINIMSRVSYIQKGDDKVNGQYRFVSHDQITAKLHPEFVVEKIVVAPSVEKMVVDGNRTEVTLKTTFINADKPDETIEIRSIGFGIDKQDKGAGKAVSYAYKYALLKMFALETGDDPDNNTDTDFEKPKENTPKEKTNEQKRIDTGLSGTTNQTYLAKKKLIEEATEIGQLKIVWSEIDELNEAKAFSAIEYKELTRLTNKKKGEIS